MHGAHDDVGGPAPARPRRRTPGPGGASTPAADPDPGPALAAVLGPYPRVATCPECVGWTLDRLADGGADAPGADGTAMVRTACLAAAALARHDSGHLLDITGTASQHFA